MKGITSHIRYIYLLGNIFILLGGAEVAFNILKYQFENPIAVGLVVANGALAAVGVIAVLVASCLKGLEGRLTKVEELR
jgi:uncharacterized integral membrane protein